MNSTSLTSMKITAFLLSVAVAAVLPLLLGYGLLATCFATSALALASAINDYAGRRPGYSLALTARRRSAALPLAA